MYAYNRSATELKQGTAHLVSLSQTCTQEIGRDIEVPTLSMGIDTCSTSGQGHAAYDSAPPGVGSAAGAQRFEVLAEADELWRSFTLNIDQDCEAYMPVRVTAYPLQVLSVPESTFVKCENDCDYNSV